MKAPITYIPNFVVDPDAVFDRLRAIAWERRPDAPRCEYYCNDWPRTYTYGRGRGQRVYEPRNYPEDVLTIRRALEATAGAKLDVCFLNRYLNQSDRLGWHADDSPEMDDARPIGVVSLGEAMPKGGRVERFIRFRPKGDDSGENVESILLAHGSLCLMAPGMQDQFEHEIPKARIQCGERISLTFRGYLDLPVPS